MTWKPPLPPPPRPLPRWRDTQATCDGDGDDDGGEETASQPPSLLLLFILPSLLVFASISLALGGGFTDVYLFHIFAAALAFIWV